MIIVLLEGFGIVYLIISVVIYPVNPFQFLWPLSNV